MINSPCSVDQKGCVRRVQCKCCKVVLCLQCYHTTLYNCSLHTAEKNEHVQYCIKVWVHSMVNSASVRNNGSSICICIFLLVCTAPSTHACKLSRYRKMQPNACTTYLYQRSHNCNDSQYNCDNQLDEHKGLDVYSLLWKDHLNVCHWNVRKGLDHNVALSHALQHIIQPSAQHLNIFVGLAT